MRYKSIFLAIIFGAAASIAAAAQQVADTIFNPPIVYGALPRVYEIAGITVSGAPNYDDSTVLGYAGLKTGDRMAIPGDDLTDDIMEHMSRVHNVKVGERTAEQIKIHVGSALTELENPPEDYIVHGPNKMTALPMEVPVSYQEISHCIEKSISRIEAAVLQALDETPPELYSDIVANGIFLAGGGAMLRGLDKRLTDKIGIQFHIAEDPLLAVAKGTGVALKNIETFSFLIR